MRQPIRVFLLVEAAAFAAAALAHSGVLVHGYEHQQARVAESLTVLVLLTGFTLSWIRPAWTREAGIVAQGFALLGTLVGLFTIAIGVGPQTAPDVAYHLGILAMLVWGLVVATRAPAGASARRRVGASARRRVGAVSSSLGHPLSHARLADRGQFSSTH